MTQISGRIDVLGVPLDPRSRAESIAALFELAGREAGCAHLVTLNPEYVMAARRNPRFASAIDRADLILADGAGVVAAARLLGGRKGACVQRLTGVEIVERLAERGTPLFLLGAGPGVAAMAAQRLSERFPQAAVSGVWADCALDEEDDAEAIRRIGESGARVVAAAFGAEGQVLWIDRNRQALASAGVRLAIGVGGALDYLAGSSARPPDMVRRIGLEWLWRLVREPWRWRRQLVLPTFAALVIGARARQVFSGRSRILD